MRYLDDGVACDVAIGVNVSTLLLYYWILNIIFPLSIATCFIFLAECCVDHCLVNHISDPYGRTIWMVVG